MRHLLLIYFVVQSVLTLAQEGEFKYNSEIIVQYAVLALEEFNADNPSQKFNLKRDYEIENPIAFGRYSTDCDQKKKRVILVTFKQRGEEEGSANVYMTYSEDDSFGWFLDRNYSIDTPEQTLNSFKLGKNDDWIWGCGF